MSGHVELRLMPVSKLKSAIDTEEATPWGNIALRVNDRWVAGTEEGIRNTGPCTPDRTIRGLLSALERVRNDSRGTVQQYGQTLVFFRTDGKIGVVVEPQANPELIQIDNLIFEPEYTTFERLEKGILSDVIDWIETVGESVPEATDAHWFIQSKRAVEGYQRVHDGGPRRD